MGPPPEFNGAATRRGAKLPGSQCVFVCMFVCGVSAPSKVVCACALQAARSVWFALLYGKS